MILEHGYGRLMPVTKKTLLLLLPLCLCLLLGGEALASGWGDYEGGMLKIYPPRALRIFKYGRTDAATTITIGDGNYAIVSAAWNGPKRIVQLQRIRGSGPLGKTRIYTAPDNYHLQS